MRKTMLALVVAALGAASLSGKAMAHDINAYVCGSSDATSTFVSFGGGLCDQLQTAANGSGSAGFSMTNIDSGATAGNNFLAFNLAGTASSIKDMFITLSTQDGFSKTIPLSAGSSKKISGGFSYLFSGSTFGAAKRAQIEEIDLQLSPGSTANSIIIGRQRVNGANFTLHTKTLSECPVL